MSGRFHFSAVGSGEIIQETIPAPGRFAKFKGSVLAGDPSPSESTSNSQHEKQYACDCIKSPILRNVLGSSQAPQVWDGTIQPPALVSPENSPAETLQTAFVIANMWPLLGTQ